MDKMTKVERVKAALNIQDVDRIPLSIWFHMPDVDQDPVGFAEKTIALTRRYDFDFIKMMPFGNYVAQDYGLSVTFFCTETKPALERKFAINTPEDWKRIEPLPGHYGTYGKQVQFTSQLRRQLGGEDIPYIQTIFSPLTTAYKLAGPRLLEDMVQYPREVHQALRAIAETTRNFCKANIEEGVAGFFFATKCASYDIMTKEQYAEFGIPYDMDVFSSFVDETYFNVLHIHGENSMFERLISYPANCINWHDRWVSPTMAEARKLTKKCLLGGINEQKFKEELGVGGIERHLSEAIQSAGRNGLMLGPGCVAKLPVPDSHFMEARAAVNRLSGVFG
ncbi:methylcobalamin:coenzyme M methyltransferase [uncultured Clostridium sp.]|nr:methylcobalamin:coenzyme M methyltransferase [uncultured Clostridium sp.]